MSDVPVSRVESDAEKKAREKQSRWERIKGWFRLVDSGEKPEDNPDYDPRREDAKPDGYTSGRFTEADRRAADEWRKQHGNIGCEDCRRLDKRIKELTNAISMAMERYRNAERQLKDSQNQSTIPTRSPGCVSVGLSESTILQRQVARLPIEDVGAGILNRVQFSGEETPGERWRMVEANARKMAAANLNTLEHWLGARWIRLEPHEQGAVLTDIQQRGTQ